MTPIITGPGSYRTREGKRVEVEANLSGWKDQYPWRRVGSAGDANDPGDDACWNATGGRYALGSIDYPTDIIGPWLDEVRIEPIPADFRPIPGRHKAVYREGRRAEVYGVTGSVFETDGRYARFSEHRDGVYPNNGCAGDRLDIVAFIDTKPDRTPTTKETPMATLPVPFTSIDQIKVGMRVLVLDKKGADFRHVSWVGSMDLFVGQTHTVAEITKGGNARVGSWAFHPTWLAPASALEAAKAEVARLEAEEAAAKVLASMPEPLRKCHEYLKANPDAFGFQRKHVVAIVEALTGGKLP